MNSKFIKSAVIGLVVVLVLSLGIVAVFAQDDTTPDTDTETTPTLPFGRGDLDTDTAPTMPFGRGDFGGRGGHHDGADDEALAAALGITPEQLQAARQKVMADRLAQAVEDGSLTQDQANTMLAMEALKSYIDRDAILAAVLGMTVDELDAARADGTLSDLMAGIDQTELQEKTQAATEAAVQQAVSDNVITQDQADLVLEQMANGTNLLGRSGGHGHSGDFDGGRGGFRTAPDQTDDTESGEAVAPFAFGA